MVKNVSVGAGGQQEWPTPIRDREWMAASGTVWRMRGGPIDPRVVRNLLKRPGVHLLHVYGIEPHELALAEALDLVESLERFYAGEAQPHADFTVADFRDDEHNVLLVVQESC